MKEKLREQTLPPTWRSEALAAEEREGKGPGAQRRWLGGRSGENSVYTHVRVAYLLSLKERLEISKTYSEYPRNTI